MAMTGGSIGPFDFYTLEGNLTTQGRILENHTEPYEDGELYVELGRHAPIGVLIGSIDLFSISDVAQLKKQYSDLVGYVVTVRLRRGDFFEYYPNWTVILPPEDITPEEEKFCDPAIGGVNNGKHWLYTRWTLHYLLPL